MPGSFSPRGLFAGDRLSPEAQRKVDAVSDALGAIPFVFGVAGLAGWFFDIPVLRHWHAGLPDMRPVSALSLTLLAGALHFGSTRPRLVRILVVATVVLALAAVFEPLRGLDALVRLVLVDHDLLAGGDPEILERAGPTPIPAALGFLFVGIAYFCGRRPKLVPVAQTMAVAAMFGALVPVLGYAYHIESLTSPMLPSSPALQSSIGIVLLSAGILLMAPQRGVIGLVSASTAGSRAARLLLVPALGLPILLGGFFLWWRRFDALNLDTAVPSFVAALAATLGGSVLWVARAGARLEVLERRSEEALRRSVDESPLIMWMSDATGAGSHANPALLEFTGFTREQVLGAGWQGYTHPDDVPSVVREITSAFQAQRPFSAELRVRHHDGGWRWVLSTGMPRFTPAHELAGYTGSWVDVTARKDAEYALQRFAAELEARVAERTAALTESKEELSRQRGLLESIVKNMGDAVLTVTLEGKVSGWNRGAERMYGYSADEATGMGLASLDPATEQGAIDTMLADIRDKAIVIRREATGRRRDGSTMDLATTMSPIHDEAGGVTGISVVHHDVSHLKATERRIQALNDELEQRVRDRTAALVAANHDLEGYASSVAHDLRTPLRAIAGFARVLEEDFAETVGDEGRRVIGVVKKNAQDMGAFIDALLSFSAVDRQPPVKTPVDVAALVRECVDSLGADCADRDVVFQVGNLPDCRADRASLKQVFLNLLANAVKFTRPNAKARIEIGSESDPSGATSYFVRDNGVGFDMSNTRRLFGIFQRLHSPGEFEGTGLGLANVARIVAAHGGRVWAEAQPGKGATFHFIIEQREGAA